MVQAIEHPIWSMVGSEAIAHAPSYWGISAMAMLLAIAISDILWRRVANKLVLSCWLSGLTLFAQGQGWPGFEAAMLASGACFVLGLLPYAAGMMGAADVKVFAAYGAWVGPGAIASLTLYGALFAGLLGAVALYERGPQALTRMALACLNPQGALDRARKSGQTMPLTVALCSGVYATLWGGPSWLF